MPGKNPFDTDDMGSEDGYYEDDYLPRVPTPAENGGYEVEFRKAISVLEQQRTRGDVVNISTTPLKSASSEGDDLYLKKVNLYRSIADKQSLTRRSIDADLDTLSTSLVSSKERWSSQTDMAANHDPVSGSRDTLNSSKAPEKQELRNSHSSQSLHSEHLKGCPKQASSRSLQRLISHTGSSSTSLHAKSTNSMDSSTSLPEGWEKVEGGSGVYYWHVPSGTTQYQHPNLSSNQDISERLGALEISIPETIAVGDNISLSGHDLPHGQHKVLNLGWMEMDTATIKGANSSVAINECIRKLGAIMQDPQLMTDLIQILTFEGTYLKLLDVNSHAVLFKQNVLSIRRWGVGSDDARDFAYVVKQTNKYRCYVLRCHVPASVVALQMQNICAQAALKRKEETMADESAATPTSPPGSTPTPPPPAEAEPKRFDTLYLGYIRVEKEKGTDVIHAAIEKLESSCQSNWECVTMEVHVSTINLMKTADRTLLAEHRIRFVSFMALGKREHHLGYIVHGGPRIFYCHVYQSDTSCADMARSIQTACNSRYQLLLAKQEELKKTHKTESPGIFSFLKKLKKKSPESEHRTVPTKI